MALIDFYPESPGVNRPEHECQEWNDIHNHVTYVPGPIRNS